MTANQSDLEVIHPIHRETVHRICSGQVVISLAIAVKELVENAIDAGATRIDVSLKEYGSQSIVVSDNGSGVIKENFQALTLKHYTSKIRRFDDLERLSTLGFRGEALSSLCALSDLSVLTKHASSSHATKITYDKNGKITSESVSNCEEGTRVTLESLFVPLPVRRKEFEKNLKREFNKMCQLLYAYCLVSKGIKISCTNTTNKGSKNSVVGTEGSNTVRENIINVFGPKQISSLVEIDVEHPDETISDEYGIKLVKGEVLPFSWEFFISSVTHGSGRSTTDRQFFYVNSRPCEPLKVMKLVNHIYKQYNANQYPFVYLNVTSTSLVDVNVTPDKRQVFLEKEKVLLAAIKSSLIETFKTFPSTFKLQNVDLSQNMLMTDFMDKEVKNRGLKRSSTDTEVKKGSIIAKFKKRSKTENDKPSQDESEVNLEHFLKIAKEIVKKQSSHLKKESDAVDTYHVEELKTKCFKSEQDKLVSCDLGEDKTIVKSDEAKEDKSEMIPLVKNEDTNVKPTNVEEVKATFLDYSEVAEHCSEGHKCSTSKICESSDTSNKTIVKSVQSSNVSVEDIISSDGHLLDDEMEISIDAKRNVTNRRCVTLNTSMDSIRELLKARTKAKNSIDVKVRFRAKIASDNNKLAEQELEKQVSKEDFAKMTVIGQFNRGFVVSRLENDLFIIDQHASDEKYNFERLQATTVMQNQVLVIPKPLELTAAKECLLIENEDVFKKNGFAFNIDHSAPCTKKVSLTAVPMSRNVILGKHDIDEMLFMLQESTHTMCRPSKIRAMFASRACRKSIMIGDALSKQDMRRLIVHMGEIEQPWNCPHGRPTMRHLLNLDLIHSET